MTKGQKQQHELEGDDLWPAPSPNRSPWPGVTTASAQALSDALRMNHERYHVFFNFDGFHNHIAHYVTSVWALGAPPETVTDAYESLVHEQRPAFDSPGVITRENFNEHLGDERYWQAYNVFFAEVLRKKTIGELLEEFVFDPRMNFGVNGERKGPEMLNRFLDGLLHPIIHTGYGIELGIPGLMVEGLSSAAVHKGIARVLIPPSLWEHKKQGKKGVHAFTILARILKDRRFDDVEPSLLPSDDAGVYDRALPLYGAAIMEYASEWSYDASAPGEAERKIEELAFMTTIMYGIGGFEKGREYNADFFNVHLVNSALFLETVMQLLKPTSQEKLLRGYLAVSLTWWVSRGLPSFDIYGFYAEVTDYPLPPGPFAPPYIRALPNPNSPKATTPNPWFHVIEHAIVNPDDHLPKMQRALAHFASVYGTRRAGEEDFTGTELKGAERLDGSLFLRVAGITKARLVRLRELHAEGPRYWDRVGLYDKQRRSARAML